MLSNLDSLALPAFRHVRRYARHWLFLLCLLGIAVGLLVTSSNIFPTALSQNAPHTPQGSNAWTSSGPQGGGVYSLARDPNNSNILYADITGPQATQWGIYKSTDGGASWSFSGFSNAIVSSLAVDPNNSMTIYAGVTQGNLTTSIGLYKSTDGGANWGITALTSSRVVALVIAAGSPTTVYAGTDSDGIFKSSNGGAS